MKKIIFIILILLPSIIYSQYQVRGELEVTGKAKIKDTIIAVHGIRFSDGTHQTTGGSSIDTSTNYKVLTRTIGNSVYVSKKDSLTKYATPKEIHDTAVLLRVSIANIVKNNLTFSGTIDLTTYKSANYNDYTISTTLAITVAANPVDGNTAGVVIIGDGIHTPTFTGLYITSGSWDIVNGHRNLIVFWQLGGHTYFEITQPTLL